MRIVYTLLALLLCVPRFAAADAIVRPVLETAFRNSDLLFGTGPSQHWGHDGEGVRVDGGPPKCCASFFQAYGSTFVQQTLHFGQDGEVVGSDYFYEGGTFWMEFWLTDVAGGPVYGTFTGSIIEMRVSDGSLDPSYLLGPGTFDGAIARALGIGTHTLGGTIRADLIDPYGTANLFGIPLGDYTSPQRGAWDGWTQVELELPEPSTLVLSGLAFATAWRRFRRPSCR